MAQLTQPTHDARIIPFPAARAGDPAVAAPYRPWLSLWRLTCLVGASLAAWGLMLAPVFLI